MTSTLPSSNQALQALLRLWKESDFSLHFTPRPEARPYLTHLKVSLSKELRQMGLNTLLWEGGE